MDQELARYFITLEASVSGLQAQFETLKGDFKGVETGVSSMSDTVKEQADKTSISWQDMAKSFGIATSAVDLAKEVFNKLKETVIESIKAYDDEIVNVTLLGLQLGKTAQTIIDYSSAQESSTRFSHQQAEAAAEKLSGFVNEKDTLLKLMPVIEDYAAFNKVDLVSAATLYSRAIEGNNASLGRYNIGIEGVSGSQERINSIIQKSNEHWGGAAKIIGDIGSGPLIEANNQFSHVYETFGQRLNPVLKSFADLVTSIQPLVDGFLSTTGYLINGVAQVIANVLHSVMGTFDVFVELADEIPAELFRVLSLIPKFLLPPSWKTGIDSMRDSLVSMRNEARDAADKEFKAAGDALSRIFSGGDEAKIPDKGKDLISGGKQTNASNSSTSDDESKIHPNREDFDKQFEWENAQDDKLAKLRNDSQKKCLDSTDKLNEHLKKENRETSLSIEKENERVAQSYTLLGESIGEAIANGIENGKNPLKAALSGMLDVLLSFWEKNLIGAIFENTAKRFGEIGVPGLLIGAAEAAGLTAVFEIAKAEVKKFGAGGPIVGPAHSAGGVMLNAEGGEYIVRGSAVQEYGQTALEAVNRGLAEIRVPGGFSGRTSMAGPVAAAGGLVAAGNPLAPIIYNVLHGSEIAKRIMATPEAKRGIINHISENSFAARAALGLS